MMPKKVNMYNPLNCFCSFQLLLTKRDAQVKPLRGNILSYTKLTPLCANNSLPSAAAFQSCFAHMLISIY